MTLAIPDAEISVNSRGYTINGKKYRRVTSVLGVINKPRLPGWAAKQVREAARAGLKDGATLEALMQPGGVDRFADSIGRAANEARDEAAAAGTAVHDALQAFLDSWMNNGFDSLTGEYACLPEKAKHGIDWLKETAYSIAGTEVTVWSDELGVAGTIDVVARDAWGDLVIWDWKTGSGPWPEMALQLGAYLGMFEDLADDVVSDAFIVKLEADRARVYRSNVHCGGLLFRRAEVLQRRLKDVKWEEV